MRHLIQDNQRFRISIIVSVVLNILVFGFVGKISYLAPLTASQPRAKLLRLTALPVVQKVQILPAVQPQKKHADEVHRVVSRNLPTDKPSPFHSHRVRFAFRRLRDFAAASISRAIARTFQHGASGAAVSSLQATSATQLVVQQQAAVAAQPVDVADAIVPQQVQQEIPVVAARTAPAQAISTSSSITPAVSTATSSLPSESHGIGNGNGEAVGSGAGTGSGSGDGRGDGTGVGNGSGGPFGIGGGGGDGGGPPKHVVYVLDVSLSMSSRIDRARAELRKALDGLRSCDTFAVETFGGVTSTVEDHLVTATDYKKAEAEGFLQAATLIPGTNLDLALQRAFAFDSVNEVVVITDGVPTEGETDFNKLARLIRQHNANGARIFTIGLVGRNPNDGTDQSFQAANLLKQIAADSGGESKLCTVGVATPDD